MALQPKVTSLDPIIRKFCADNGAKGGLAKGKSKVRGGKDYYSNLGKIGGKHPKKKAEDSKTT